MSQTILIESNPDLAKIFSLNLNTYSGTDVILRKNADDAIQLLSILPTVNLIISQAKIEDEETALKLFYYLQENGLEIPLIVIGEVSELKLKVLCLKEPVQWEVIVEHASELLGVSLKEVKSKIKPVYTQVPALYFYEIKETPCDIFIRIKKSPSEYQFIKRIHSGDSFDIDVIKNYESQGLKSFWVPTDYTQYFVNFITNNLVKKLEGDISIQDRIEINANSLDIVSDHIKRFGLDNAIVELSDANIKSMIKSVTEAPELSSLLKMLFTSKISYAYQHAHLICVIGNFILSRQSWYKPKHLKILSFAAFFSDITLKSLIQAKINSTEELDASALTQEEREEVLRHAKDASLLLKDHPKFDDYLETVIIQHHGSLTGIGFAENPSEEIHPISKVFIIADAFVKEMLSENTPKNKVDILEKLYKRFLNPSYQKIIKVLEQKIE